MGFLANRLLAKLRTKKRGSAFSKKGFFPPTKASPPKNERN